MGAIARAALAEYESGEGRGEERVDVDVREHQRGPFFYYGRDHNNGDSAAGRGRC